MPSAVFRSAARPDIPSAAAEGMEETSPESLEQAAVPARHNAAKRDLYLKDVFMLLTSFHGCQKISNLCAMQARLRKAANFLRYRNEGITEGAPGLGTSADKPGIQTHYGARSPDIRWRATERRAPDGNGSHRKP